MYRVVRLQVVILAAVSLSCSSDGLTSPKCGMGNPCPPDRVTSLQFIPGKDSLLVGDRAQIIVRALDSAGAPMTDVPFQYASSNTGVATVDETGIVTALGTGVAILTLHAGDKEAHDSLFVFSAALFELDGGGETTCALQNLGRSFCWGLNSVGQLGFASDSVCFGEFPADSLSPSCSIFPRAVSEAPHFASISAGDSLTCGLVTDGSAACWGANSSGQIGNGTNVQSPVPSRVFGAANFTAVEAGGRYARGLDASGIAYCWGNDEFGQLGDARRVNSTTPIPVVSSQQTPVLFASVTAGYLHTCGLTATGTAYCWGANSRGQLGTGNTTSSEVPVPVAGGLTFSVLSAGIDTSISAASRSAGALPSSFTCGLANGAAYCWGAGLGEPSTPTLVGAGLSFVQLSAGGAHACALTQSGAAYCWGFDGDDQLGNGPGPSNSATPVAVGGGLSFASISAGRRHTCGITTDGASYCWGSDVYGALGNTYQAAFRGLPQPVGSPLVSASASIARSIARPTARAVTVELRH
jgi:alpha-tubulin suppressor-like RCC1 family protein